MNAVPFDQQEILLMAISLALFVAGVFILVLALKSGAALKKETQEAAEEQHGLTAIQPNQPQSLEAAELGAAEAATRAQASAERSWFARLSQGLSKTQSQLVRQLETLFANSGVIAGREAILDSMLEVLVRADVGVRTAERLIEKLRTDLPAEKFGQADAALTVVKDEILRILSTPGQSVSNQSWCLSSQGASVPQVVLMVGVNGVGKTTTTGKLAFKLRRQGKTVIVGAADTFRAAAVDQLEEWARRSGAECVRMAEGSDPASVAFECVKKAVADKVDLCLIDTAGRLHNRNDLMQELSKVRRVVGKGVTDAPHEVLLVLDATTGQNALQQAKVFKEVAGVTGLVLTKLDGTAKGGVAIALAAELNLPIRFVGVGEAVEDLQPFEPSEFVDALFAPAVGAVRHRASEVSVNT